MAMGSLGTALLEEQAAKSLKWMQVTQSLEVQHASKSPSRLQIWPELATLWLAKLVAWYKVQRTDTQGRVV